VSALFDTVFGVFVGAMVVIAWLAVRWAVRRDRAERHRRDEADHETPAAPGAPGAGAR